MRANTFRAKNLIEDGRHPATVWGGSLRHGEAGKLVGRDLAAMTVEIEFEDGRRDKFDYRHVALGDNSFKKYPKETPE